MKEKKAIYYGQVELIPGVLCDGYVLDDEQNSTVMSERGTADLLGMAHTALQSMATTGIKKTLKNFIDKDLSMATTLVKVVAANSPYKGRDIVVYSSDIIEALMRGYALALGHNKLQKNQMHIGRRCILLHCSLAKTALDAAIKEACGLRPEIQKIAQEKYVDAVSVVQKMGFRCSAGKEMATKKDLLEFLKVPESTLNAFLRKHANRIKPIALDLKTIHDMGCKASHINGYFLEDATKIILGMDTEKGIEIKKSLFGETGTLLMNTSKEEVQWRGIFSKVFKGLGLQYNYKIGNYRVDYFVEAMDLCLECNGYEHKFYKPEEERKRERFIKKRYGIVRFHHQSDWESLMNGILKAKPGKIIRLNAPVESGRKGLVS